MLNAIAREVGHAADAVTSAAGAAVEAVLPGKSSRDDAPTEDEDVHRKGSDQEQGKQQDKQSKKDQAKVRKTTAELSLLQAARLSLMQAAQCTSQSPAHEQISAAQCTSQSPAHEQISAYTDELISAYTSRSRKLVWYKQATAGAPLHQSPI
jgi:murein L,D-transpeptidase YcbB/YkuD